VTVSQEHRGRAKREQSAIRVVLIDDDASDRDRVAAIVASDVVPVEIVEIADHVSFFQALKNPDFDLVITEQDLHWSSGQEVLTAIKSLQPSIPVIMVARSENEAIAAAALKEGVDAYIPKSGELAIRLRSSVRSALQKMEAQTRADKVESRLKGLLDRLNVGVFRATADGKILEANAALLKLVGVGSLKAAGELRLADLFVSESEHVELLARLEDDGQVRDFQAEIKRRDGSTAWVSLTEIAQLPDGREKVIEGMMEDVTASREAREAVRRSSEDYRAIFEITSAATIILEGDSTVSMANTAFEHLSGYTRRDIEGKLNWDQFVSGADLDRVRGQMNQVLYEPHAAPRSCRFDFTDRRGRSLHVLATVALLPGTRRFVISLLNMTERQRVEDQLLHNAFHDGLTGLPNRLSLLDRMETLLSREGGESQNRFALILLGIDRFRVVNDSLGHRVGDLLLQAIARRLEGVLSDVDTIARCSGDVFGIIAGPPADDAEATSVVSVVSESLVNPFSFGDHVLHSAASFGVVISGGDRDANELYRDAEAAMYEAKRKAPGRWMVFDPSIRERVEDRFSLENDLRQALSSGELHTHYQPIASLADGRILGFEALLRWRRAGGEIILPSEFLDVAESTGLIVPIGREVLRSACDRLGHWDGGGSVSNGLFVSVNLSRKQLHHPGLMDDVGEALAGASIAPENLMLEVAEGVLADDDDPVMRILMELGSLGVQLCLDGFGTAESSLSALSSCPFTTVKIDRSFLNEIGDDTNRWRLLDGVHALALHLRLRTIVVGIEDQAQLRRLLDLGCTVGQGLLLSAAVDEERATRLLRAHPVW
jgi:Amt family ammonium transporter